MKCNAHHEILITIAAASVAISLSGVSLAANATSKGVEGYSGKNPKFHCAAFHTGGTQPLNVTINGPATADIDSSVTYAISVYGSPGNIGGLNVASDHDTLEVVNTDMRVAGAELAHRIGHTADATGAVRFEFGWHAPQTSGTATLFVAGVLGDRLMECESSRGTIAV